MMKKLFGLSLMALMCVGSAQADLLNNQSFESGLDNWSSWNSGNIITPSDWGWAQEGSTMAGMWSTAGLWQDFNVTAGSTYLASVYAYEASSDAMTVGSKYAVAKLEWYTSGGAEIGTDAWSVNIGGTGTGYDAWTKYSSTEIVAPETAAYGRLNLEIQGSGDGRIYYDNASVAAVVPEPSILAMVSLGLGTLFLTLRRKIK